MLPAEVLDLVPEELVPDVLVEFGWLGRNDCA